VAYNSLAIQIPSPMTNNSETKGNLSESLNILTKQIDRLTEVVTGFAELKDLVREQVETSKRQEQMISRLVDKVARQADIGDVLIRDRQRN
jgi:hypothetical protein